MKFKYQLNESLPPLAWLVKFNKRGELRLCTALWLSAEIVFLYQEYGMENLRRVNLILHSLFMEPGVF